MARRKAQLRTMVSNACVADAASFKDVLVLSSSMSISPSGYTRYWDRCVEAGTGRHRIASHHECGGVSAIVGTAGSAIIIWLLRLTSTLRTSSHPYTASFRMTEIVGRPPGIIKFPLLVPAVSLEDLLAPPWRQCCASAMPDDFLQLVDVDRVD
jgi:hypothetical protein